MERDCSNTEELCRLARAGGVVLGHQWAGMVPGTDLTVGTQRKRDLAKHGLQDRSGGCRGDAKARELPLFSKKGCCTTGFPRSKTGA